MHLIPDFLSFRRIIFISGWLAMLLLLVSCLPAQRTGLSSFDLQRQVSPYNGRLNLFLTLEDRPGPPVQLELANIEILVNDLWLPLIEGPILLESKQIGHGQVFLGGMDLPPGQFTSLRVTYSKAFILKSDGAQEDAPQQAEQIRIDLPRPVDLKTTDSKSLHFVWDVEGSVLPNGSVVPALFVSSSLRQLSSNLLFVSCPEINTIFIIRTDKNWVVDSFGIRGRPTYLALDPASAGQRLYVLTPVEKKLKVVDLASQRVIQSYPTLNDETTHLTISPDGDQAYLVHEKSGYVSQMNLRTGQIVARVMLGSRPNYVTYLEQQRLLAVSMNFADRVALLDPDDLRLVKALNTGSRPEGVIAIADYLYVAENGDASVASIDLTNVSNRTKLMVGFGPKRILNTDDQIMVSNYTNGSLSVLLPGQLGVVQEIHGFGNPLEMAFDPLYRQLYVADVGKSALAIVDTNSNQLLGHLSLGAKPLGLTRVQ